MHYNLYIIDDLDSEAAVATQAQYYNIDAQTKYHMTISPCHRIEDVGDVFVTVEELREQGVYVSPHDKSKTVVNGQAINAAVNHYIELLEKSDKISIVVPDPDLIDILKTNREFLYDRDESVRIRKDRIGYYKKPKPRIKKKPTKTDAHNCIRSAIYTAEAKYGVSFGYIPKYCHSAKLLKVFKKLVSWKDIKEHKSYYFYEKKWMKLVWKNPEDYLP